MFIIFPLFETHSVLKIKWPHYCQKVVFLSLTHWVTDFMAAASLQNSAAT